MTAEQNIGKRAQNFQVIALDLSEERTIDKPYEIPIEGTIVGLSPSAGGVYEVDVRFVNDRSRVFTATPPMTLQAGSVIRGIPFHRLVITHKTQNATAQIIVSQDDGLNLDFGDASAISISADNPIPVVGVGGGTSPVVVSGGGGAFPEVINPESIAAYMGKVYGKVVPSQPNQILWKNANIDERQAVPAFTVPAGSWGSRIMTPNHSFMASHGNRPVTNGHFIFRQAGMHFSVAFDTVGTSEEIAISIAVRAMRINVDGIWFTVPFAGNTQSGEVNHEDGSLCVAHIDVRSIEPMAFAYDVPGNPTQLNVSVQYTMDVALFNGATHAATYSIGSWSTHDCQYYLAQNDE